MTAIYVLADANLPEAKVLEAGLRKVAGERYPVEVLPHTDALLGCLGAVRQAVVFFATAPERLAFTVNQLRGVLPATACVAVVDGELHDIAVFETDCHFLKRNLFQAPSPPDAEFWLATQLSEAVRQAELLATISGSAQLDEVTSLFNRRYFIQRLGEEISLARRHLSPLCCVVLGVNFYRMYLDSYGYEFINALFRFLADKVTGSVRHEDIVARLSDDEIGILLPRSTEKGARVFANRLILNLNASVFKYDAYEEEISVCAGLVGYPLPDETSTEADTLIRYGRHALHQARCLDEDQLQVQLFSEIKPVL